MVTRRLCVLLGLICLVGTTGVFAQTDPATAEALMRRSGLWQQMASVAGQVRAGFLQAVSQSGATPSPSEVDRFAAAIDASYSVDRLRATAKNSIQQHLGAEHVTAISEWYESPVGKAATRLEELASLDQTDLQMVLRQGAVLLSSMPSDRRATLEELAVVTRSAEALAQLTIDTTLAAQRGAISMSPATPGPSAFELKTALEAQRPQMLKTFTALTLASFAKAYETLSTFQLRQYVEFLSSEAGRHFTGVGLRAFSESLVEASVEFGRRLPGTSDKSNT